MPEDPKTPDPAAEIWGGPTSRWRLLCAGFIGGILSPMVRPLQEFLAVRHYPAEIGLDYWLLAVFLGFLGLGLVVVLKETEALKALTLGLSLPAFLISLGGAVQNSGDKAATGPTAVPARVESQGGLGGIPFFSASAYADDAATPGNIPGRMLELAAVDQPFAYRADLLDTSGRVVSSFAVLEKNSPLVTRALPAEVTGIRFVIGESQSVTYPVGGQPGWTIGIALHADIQRKLGLAQALGKAPELQAQISAEVEPRPKAVAGLQGWIFLGNHDRSGWGIQTVDTGEAIPKAGDIVKVLAPVNVRDAARSKQPRLGIVSSGQRVKLLSDPQGAGAFWAQVEVQPDSPAAN